MPSTPQTGRDDLRADHDEEPLSRIAATQVKRLRKARGWSVATMTEKLNEAGWSGSHHVWTNVEYRAGRRVTVDMAFYLMKVFGITFDQLIGNAYCDTCNCCPPPGFTCNHCGRQGAGDHD